MIDYNEGLRSQLNNVLPGEKVEVEPYMLHNCTTEGTFTYTYDLTISPVSNSDPAPLDNVTTQQSTVIVEANGD